MIVVRLVDIRIIFYFYLDVFRLILCFCCYLSSGLSAMQILVAGNILHFNCCLTLLSVWQDCKTESFESFPQKNLECWTKTDVNFSQYDGDREGSPSKSRKSR